MTAQPKPTAADVAADHIRCTATRLAVPDGTPFGAATMTCGSPLPPAGRDFHAAHIAERMAAAGLLATASPFPCCRHCAEDKIHDVEKDQHDVECQLCTTAEHDAQVRADAITEVWDQAREAIRVTTAERDELRQRIDRVLELADSLERDPGEVGPLILVAEDIRRVAT
jgi:hypothetical protein